LGHSLDLYGWLFDDELEIFLQVVGQGGHDYMFVCLLDPAGIEALHVGEVDQGYQHGLYGFAPDFGRPRGILLVLGELLVHLVIQSLVNGVADCFFKRFADAGGAKGTVVAVFSAAAVYSVGIAMF
jgi:hypothetical protein